MKLDKLLKNVRVDAVHGPKSVELTGICSDSRKVGPGNLFIAKKGAKTDGSKFIAGAISAGAQAVVTDLYDPFLRGATQVIASSIRSVEGKLAAEYYGHPSRSLTVAGVTGTKGKTTTTYMLRHLLGSGLLGTIEYDVGSARYDATHTTPDVVLVHRLLREMANAGLRSATLEVSSHALDQGRVDEVEFDVAVYTNLTPDHLDYHITMEAYIEAKSLFFRHLSKTATAVYNVDCPYHEQIAGNTKAQRLSYGIDHPADLMASEIHLSADGSSFILSYKGERVKTTSPLVGKHNISNALGAIGAAIVCGLSLHEAAAKAATFPQVPGRLERVENAKGLTVYVDFAHTGKSLETVLESVRGLTKGQVITVFGCGGDRDPGRRTGMATAVEKLSDVAIITSDNPRTEDPNKIIADIVAGFQVKQQIHQISDRRKAIAFAISLAKPDDLILVAGRGHERHQIIGNQTVPFDDREVVREVCLQVL